MTVIEAMRQRKSVRAYLPDAISTAQIHRILDAARHAPSGANTQPWQVAVVQGATKEKLCTRLEAEFHKRGTGDMDYDYYPPNWHEPYKRRRVDCGALLYNTLNIERKDREGRLRQWVANYHGFGAPVILFFFIDPSLAVGSYLDYGMFLQSVMLAAEAEGLATCPQAALGQFPEVTRETLGYSQEMILLCGIALGYEDKAAPVNSYRTPREDVAAFTRFFE